ncbi:MAG: geranylgeranyl diphosphate reductase [Alphaproteobacteria bacterium]|nr:geranylgeranyl diphosphate reductase [Alphaproteobacteria bacterium]
MSARHPIFDVVVIGGGPSGATAADDLARMGRSVLLLDKPGRIKPCGGAIPPRLIRDFAIPDHLLVARAQRARMISPASREVDMPIEGGFVGMVDRADFDAWLRERAARAGASRRDGTFERLERDDQGRAVVCYRPTDPTGRALGEGEAALQRITARAVIGADGARSQVAGQALPDVERTPCVFAYHEIIESPPSGEAGFAADRCDVFYQGQLSPDFYAWIFPHGDTASVGVGSALKGFSLRGAVTALRRQSALEGRRTIRREGAPIPLRPLKRWDNGRDLVVAGDAAGVVAPASGEGIYYAMAGGRFAADAVHQFLRDGDPRALGQARRAFMRQNRQTFMVLGIMQHFWYRSDKRRESFVKMCADPDVQRLTWQAYMNKELVRADPAAHARVFFKDLGHLLGLSPA